MQVAGTQPVQTNEWMDSTHTRPHGSTCAALALSTHQASWETLYPSSLHRHTHTTQSHVLSLQSTFGRLATTAVQLAACWSPQSQQSILLVLSRGHSLLHA